MDIDCLPFKETGYFSKLIIDYIEEKEQISNFYNRFPSLDNFQAQIIEKEANFPKQNRLILNEALLNQYKNTQVSDLTRDNIELLKNDKTFTVVTGHQLNLFTGPLYFLYKIISTINLTTELKQKYPENNFVPVYWMATEDHDFDEINYFNFGGKKIQWNKKVSGAVGKIALDGLDEVFAIYESQIGGSKNAEALKELFKNAYLNHANLTDATRYLANALFGEYGLVIVDGDSPELKKQLVTYIKKDVFENTAFKKVSETIEIIKEASSSYNVQVNPREINYFYLADGVRERIVEKDGKYVVNDTNIEFSEEELKKDIENNPENYSPNVIARPLYQEVILPNLCYIGGGGEIAYWLELKRAFKAMEVTFPMLLVRNSALVITEKQEEKLDKMNLSVKDLFLNQHSFINKKIREISNIEIDFSKQKQLLSEHFSDLYTIAKQTDGSFLGAVKAQEVKQLKGLENLEKRLLKAQRIKLKDHVVRMVDIQNELFPNKSLQERNQNFSELYLEYGSDLIPNLIQKLKPLVKDFLIIKM